ncbi:MAG: hypothetical protein AAF443_02995 [Chlamydiota bacterium]
MANKRVGDPSLPYNPEPQRDEEEKIDPEKFKKVLKVDESDETSKRQKRRLKKGEEEGEDEEVEEAAPSSPASDFSELMEEKDDSGSIFDSQSKGKQYRQASTSPSPYEPSAYSSTEDDQESKTQPETPTLSDFEEGNWPNADSEEPAAFSQESFELPTEEQVFFAPTNEEEEVEAAPLSEPPASFQQEGAQPPVDQDENQQEPDQPPPLATTEEKEQPGNEKQHSKAEEKEKEKAKKEADSSLLASQPKKDALLPKKKKKDDQGQPDITEMPAPEQAEVNPAFTEEEAQVITPTKKEEEIEGKKIPAAEEALPEAQSVAEEGGVLPEESTAKKKLTVTFRRLTAQETRKKKKRTIATEEEGETTGMKQDKRKDQDKPFIEADEGNAGIPLPALTETLPPVQPADGPAYSKLSPEVYELFEKVGGVMMVQNDGGITTTTVTLNMPDTVFNDAQIVLDKYSTAPHAFNLQLIGSPEAVQAFSDNIDQLSQAFKDAQYNFEVNILSPILQTKEKKPLIRRKSATGDKGGNSGDRHSR